MAHGHSRIKLQFSRLRASLEGRTTLPKVNANVEEQIRTDAVPETGDECRPLSLRDGSAGSLIELSDAVTFTSATFIE
jgi:hypothetical protein